MPDSTLLHQAIQSLQSGDKATAQRLLKQLLAAEPDNDQAWLWLAACLTDAEKQRFCLQKALAIRPDNSQARQALQQLEARLASQNPSNAAPGEEPSPQAVQADPPSPGGKIPEASPETEPLQAEEAAPLPAAAPPQEPDLPAAEAPARAPGKPAQVVRRKKSPGLTAAQWIFLFLLGLVAILALLGLGVVALQNGALLPFLPTVQSSIPEPPAQPATKAVFQLPPTWTPTPSPPATATPPATAPPRLASPTPLPSLLPSITPIAMQWRIVPGHSVEKRPVEVFRFGVGKKERMIVAGIHGAYEKNTILLADRLIEHLRQNPDVVPPGVTLYILRSLNPDGEAAGITREGRLNANGVDLNRNFDANWKATWDDENCASETGSAGASPGSEPETQAFTKFLAERKVEVLINYHSAGLGIFPSGQPPHAESQRLAQDIAEISDYPYPPVKTGCEYTGTLVDWASQNGVIAAVDLELSNHQDSEFETNLKILRLLLDWQPIPPTATPLTPTPLATTPPATTLTKTAPASPAAASSPSATATPKITAFPSPSATPR